MSRIGKKEIIIPDKTDVKLNGGVLTVKGPLGELSREFKDDIKINIADKKIHLEPVKMTLETRALWGTTASHIVNMINGVNKAYEKRLMLEGIGYKADLKGDELTLSLGFSHTIKVKVPKGLKVTVDKNGILISGSDIELVGQFAAKVREYKKPEPYKGKGIRYEGEHVRRKQGKKTV